ncbi:MAG: rpe, Ribulose-phosphate 3-epimerase [Candidatus Saccharibacteria bacterium]|nr:rpe, Ribulose-phosphate 3-epimerase [Candidatus Saccharibacteria bacterium]
MGTVVPCVTVSTPEEYKASLERIHLFATRIHVDISDGVFAPTKLIGPEHIWWPQGWEVDVHVMAEQPSFFVPQLVAIRPHMVTLHVETKEDLLPMLQQMKQVGIKVGISLMRQTVPSDFAGLIEAADHVMIFSGELGKYGGTASLMQLEKIRLIKNINAGAEIGWDGGISIENAFSLAQGGVEVFNVGGAIQKAADPQAAYNALVKEVNKQGVM